jgi:hypothetical protein
VTAQARPRDPLHGVLRWQVTGVSTAGAPHRSAEARSPSL